MFVGATADQDRHRQHGEFAIGIAFTNGRSLWRCTDIGTRTGSAVRIDSAVVTSVMVRGGKPGPQEQSVVGPHRDPSCLNGPPSALAGTVFGEYAFAALRPIAEEDAMG